jgi:hypothetical protein
MSVSVAMYFPGVHVHTDVRILMIIMLLHTGLD